MTTNVKPKPKPQRLISRCEKCGEVLTGEAAATRHAAATKHTRYRTIFG